MSSEKISQITTKTFTPPHPLKTAVLFLVFNRPDTTKQVFEAIRKAKPPRLYVTADGPRADKAGEQEKCEQVRLIATQVDWDCEVKTLFRDKNLGCKVAVSSAIDWFFENEEEGIILEDDCLPSQSFFWFCEELLERYKDDMRIWHIGGYKYPGLGYNEYSYTFSRFTHIWGWATWQNRWKNYDADLKLYKKVGNNLAEYEFFKNKYQIKQRKKILDEIVNGKLDTWDYQWNFTVRINNGLAIRPRENLIRNIGFMGDATHTAIFNSKIINNKEKNIKFPLRQPEFVMIFSKSDETYMKEYIDNTLMYRIAKKIEALL